MNGSSGGGDASRSDPSSVFRFLLLGGANTLVTTLLFVLLMMVGPYALAYVASFLTGVAINALLVPRFVFQVGRDRRASLGIGLFSLPILTLGAVLSAVCESRGWSPLPTAIAVGAVVVPVNFLGSRLIVRWQSRQGRQDVEAQAFGPPV